MRLYLASSNRHKLEEVAAILEAVDPSIRVLSAGEVGGMPEVDEDTDTFVGNARKKALGLADRVPTGGYVLSDDSGLCVDGLGGDPGVRSSRFAGEGATDGENTALLLRRMRDIPAAGRAAHFRCVLVLLGPDREEVVFDGRCHGRIAEEPSGGGGFGYDPVFVPEGEEMSFAEIPADLKNRISHRAVAMGKLVDWLRSARSDLKQGNQGLSAWNLPE